MIKKVGFIGTGVMGCSMAKNLMDAGFELQVFTRTKEKAQPLLQAGARWCACAGEAADGADAVITIVGYPCDVESVYLAQGGIVERAKRGAYLIDMTTSDPELARRIYKAAAARGLHALDAPVSGGDSGAKAGTLAVMVGGDRADFDACLPLFNAMGENIVYEGKSGAGQHVKLANQIAIAGAVAGVAEAVAYGRAAGLDVNLMLDTISRGAAGSWQMSYNGPKMAAGDVSPGFYVKHFIKDMHLALTSADEAGLYLPVLDEVCSMYVALAEEGHADEGTQAIISQYE